MTKIAVGGIFHESNTYCSDATPLGDFTVHRDEEITRSFAGTRTYIGGMLDGAEKVGASVVPLLFADAEPSGAIDASAYETLAAELLEKLSSALPVDAVGLALHGAGVVEGIDDLEGDISRRVRDVVGPDVPIVVTLDLHGNLTQDMADTVDVMLGVHYYPHTDPYERGVEAVELVPRLLSGELQPVTHLEFLPILVTSGQSDSDPILSANELCWRLEREMGLIDCTIFHGFAYCDIPEVGMNVVVCANGDRSLAEQAAKTVASWLWEHRAGLAPDLPYPEEAIARARVAEGRPVVINDCADNPGGGAPGDATHVLRAMIDAELENACFGFIYDPEVADAAHAAGTGATIAVKLGGKHDDLHGDPIEAEAYVKGLTDGRFTYRKIHAGVEEDLGRTARLVIGGIDVIVGSARTQTFDPELFLLHGIDVTRYDIVALKSTHHFRAGFADLAAEIVTADSPGLTTYRISAFPRVRSPWRMWPTDSDAPYPAAAPS